MGMSLCFPGIFVDELALFGWLTWPTSVVDDGNQKGALKAAVRQQKGVLKQSVFGNGVHLSHLDVCIW
jgi:hypothetical protein